MDVAICEFSGKSPLPRLLGFSSQEMPRLIRNAIHKGEALNACEVAELNLLLGYEFAGAIKKAARKIKLPISKIDLIGSHGQTIYHHSGKGSRMSTLQIADGDVIATACGVPVFSDFRMKDIALGGEGAPLTPYADHCFFGTKKRRAVLNLGGIANLTLLDPACPFPLGFDVGPANAPIDRIVKIATKGRERFDRDGARARSGNVSLSLLDRLLREDRFLKRVPPKSAGSEIYGDAFVERLIRLHGKVDKDLLATVVEFVAVSIARAFRKWSDAPELIVAGGGAKNRFLMQRLQVLLAPVKILLSDELGVPSQAREAMAFALLARQALVGNKVTCHRATGAIRGAALGKLSLPD